MGATFEEVVVSFLGQDTTLGPLLTKLSGAMGLSGKEATAMNANFGKMLAGAVTAGAGIAILAGEFYLLKGAIDVASQQQSRYTRLNGDLGRTGDQTMATMKEWEPTVDGISKSTDRLNSDVMTMVDHFALVGVTSKDMMTQLTTTSAAVAFQSTNTTDTVSTAFAKFIESGKVMPKTLANFGISMDDLGIKTTADWTAMTVAQRQAAIAHLGTMDKFKNANSAYGQTFEGMVNRIKIDWEDLQMKVGTLVIPIVAPILEGIAGALEAVLGVFKLIPEPLQLLLIGLPLLAGFFLVVLGVMMMLAPGLAILGTMLGVDAAAVGFFGVASAAASAGVGFLADAIDMLFLSNPIGWIILAIVAIVAIISYFHAWGGIISWFQGAWAGLVAFFAPTISTLQSTWAVLWAGIQSGVKEAWSVIGPAIDMLMKSLGQTGGSSNILASIVNFLSMVLKGMGIILMFLAPYIAGVFTIAVKILGVVIAGVIIFIVGIINAIKIWWNILNLLWSIVVKVAQTVYNFFKGAHDAAVAFLQPIIDLFNGIITTINNAIAALSSWNTAFAASNPQAPSQGGTDSTSTGGVKTQTTPGGIPVQTGGFNLQQGTGTLPGQGPAGGEITVHQHNEAINIDASHMSEAQLKGMLITIYEGIAR